MRSEPPLLVSIITPVLNSAASLDKTIESVLTQTYQPIEYLILDGGSTDGTLDIARRYGDRLTLVSEPDRGQSDAINKGWRRAKGDLLAYINADDRYFPDAVAKAVAYFDAHPEAGWVYGDPIATTASGETVPFRRATQLWDYDKLLKLGVYISQPTTFIRRRVVDEFGLFDESLTYTMDYEYWLRIGKKYPGHFLPDLRVMVTRSRKTLTQMGGQARSLEMRRVVAQYGGHELPVYARHLHAAAYARGSVQHLIHGELRQAVDDQRELWRYPSAAVWGISKLVARAFLSEDAEGRLRRILLRRRA